MNTNYSSVAGSIDFGNTPLSGDAQVSIVFTREGFTLITTFQGSREVKTHTYRFPIEDMEEALVKIYERVRTLNARN